jgi:hypothetical protein
MKFAETINLITIAENPKLKVIDRIRRLEGTTTQKRKKNVSPKHGPSWRIRMNQRHK